MVPIDHDKIFIAGGYNPPHGHLGDAWIFDTKTFSIKLAFDDRSNFRHSSDYNQSAQIGHGGAGSIVALTRENDTAEAVVHLVSYTLGDERFTKL